MRDVAERPADYLRTDMSARRYRREVTTLAYTIRTAALATGLSRKSIERAIKSGALPAKRTSVTRDGEPAGSYLILASALAEWLERLPDA